MSLTPRSSASPPRGILRALVRHTRRTGTTLAQPSPLELRVPARSPSSTPRPPSSRPHREAGIPVCFEALGYDADRGAVAIVDRAVGEGVARICNECARPSSSTNRARARRAAQLGRSPGRQGAARPDTSGSRCSVSVSRDTLPGGRRPQGGRDKQRPRGANFTKQGEPPTASPEPSSSPRSSAAPSAPARRSAATVDCDDSCYDAGGSRRRLSEAPRKAAVAARGRLRRGRRGMRCSGSSPPSRRGGVRRNSGWTPSRSPPRAGEFAAVPSAPPRDEHAALGPPER